MIRYDKSKIQDSYDRCREITRKEARNFYFGFISLPDFRRRSIAAVYALSRRWDDIADGDLPVNEKANRLEEEKAKLNRIQHSTVRDPVLIAIQHTVSEFGIPWSYFYRLLNGVGMDLNEFRYNTLSELLNYCFHVASIPGLIVLEIFGYTEKKAKTYATYLGYAMQLTNILRDIKKDLRRNRIYLPLEDLREQGVTEDQLLEHSRFSTGLKRVLKQMALHAEFYFHKSKRLFPLLVPSSRTCPLILMNLYGKILKKIKRRNYNVLDHPVHLTVPEKVAILFNSIFFHPFAV